MSLSRSGGYDGARNRGRAVVLRYGPWTNVLSTTWERADSRLPAPRHPVSQKLCDSPGEPELTQVREAMWWRGGVGTTGVYTCRQGSFLSV